MIKEFKKDKKFCSLLKKKGECLEWQGSKNVDGYGYYRKTKAHRHAWALVYGGTIKGMFICHTCDNPSCCNIKHLFQASQKDNLIDFYQKRGAKRQNKNKKLDSILIRIDPTLKINFKTFCIAHKTSIQRFLLDHIKKHAENFDYERWENEPR